MLLLARDFSAHEGHCRHWLHRGIRPGNDQHHVWAVDIAKQITESLVTCEAVLAEAAFQLESSSYVLALLQDEMLRLAFDCNRNIAPLAELARRYRDRNPDLADLCLIRMSELYPRHVVITVDGDFRVYRRNRREAIPIHLPPQRPCSSEASALPSLSSKHSKGYIDNTMNSKS